MAFLEKKPDGSYICAIKVIPGVSRTTIQGRRGEELVVKIAAAPEKGKANAALLSFLATFAGCPKSSLSIVSGEHSQHKSVLLPKAAAESLIPFEEKS